MKEINIPKKNIIIFITLLLTAIFIIFACNHIKFQIANDKLQILDIANNDVSKQYTPLLVKHYQKLHPVYEQPREPIRIHAATPFQNGALLLISSFETKGNPLLVYLEERKILATAHASVTTFYYTSLMDHTIYYGLMYPGYDNKEITRDFSYRVDALFSNGEKKSHECAPVSYTKTSADGNAPPNGAYAGGYIFVNEGLAWLDEVTFYDSNGGLDIDTSGIENTPSFNWKKGKPNYTPRNLSRAELASIVEKLDLSPLIIETIFIPFSEESGNIRLVLNGPIAAETGEVIPYVSVSLFPYLNDDNFDFSFVWMQKLILEDLQPEAIKANGEVFYSIHDMSRKPEKYSPISSELKVHTLIGGKDEGIYWLNLSQIPSNKDVKGSFIESRTAPAEEGIYCVYVEYDGWYHTAIVQVVR